jgi:hypothetical protein
VLPTKFIAGGIGWFAEAEYVQLDAGDATGPLQVSGLAEAQPAEPASNATAVAASVSSNAIDVRPFNVRRNMCVVVLSVERRGTAAGDRWNGCR